LSTANFDLGGVGLFCMDAFPDEVPYASLSDVKRRRQHLSASFDCKYVNVMLNTHGVENRRRFSTSCVVGTRLWK